MRSVTCVDAKLQPAPANACQGLTAPAATRACNTAACVGHTWQVGACPVILEITAMCSAFLRQSHDWFGEGSHTNLDSLSQTAPDDSSRTELLVADSMQAGLHAMQVGQWGDCSQACGGGIRERSVQCVTQFQQPAPDNASCAGVQPADQLQCNVLPCNFCSQTNCAGQVTHLAHHALQNLALRGKPTGHWRLPEALLVYCVAHRQWGCREWCDPCSTALLPMSAQRPGVQGVCKGGVCVCQPGYRGAYCEIPPACSGILDQDGNCCATGIVSQNGTCCAQASTPSCAHRCYTSVYLACGSSVSVNRPDYFERHLLLWQGECTKAPPAWPLIGSKSCRVSKWKPTKTCRGQVAQALGCKLAAVLLQGAVLDRHSACCASGILDACGACGGPARAVDVQNVCCSSGQLDGDGYCCQSGLVDECGVCDGQSTACRLLAVLDVQVSVHCSLPSHVHATMHTFTL